MLLQGSGSDRRRKSIISNRFRDEAFFASHHSEFNESFSDTASNFEELLRETIEYHVDNIDSTLDILRDESVAVEGEKDPAFRERVTDAVRKTKNALQNILHGL